MQAASLKQTSPLPSPISTDSAATSRLACSLTMEEITTA